jgi:hypothetical protein
VAGLIAVTSIAFVVLALDGEATLRLPCSERQALLDEITIDGPPSVVEVVDSFDDGPALWDAIIARPARGRPREAATRALSARQRTLAQSTTPPPGRLALCWLVD